ncbi:MAG: phosphodiester glycosidase family protein [Oscillospiraceae bacterium]|nr:phosphodiester glycosidase family protein [Oscillospiraceae bacterium]
MSNFSKLGKKSIAVILAVLMLLPCMLSGAFAANLIDEALLYPNGIVTEEKYYTVTKGVTEKYVVLNSTSKDNQIKNYIYEVDLTNEDLSIVAGYNKCDGNPTDYGMLTLPEQVNYAEKNRGTHVVAAINGGYYNTRTGEPSGLLIMDGKMLHDYAENTTDTRNSFFAILHDGTAVIRRPGGRTDDVKEAISGGYHLVENGVYLNVSDNSVHPRSTVGIKADGTVVFMVSDGRQSPDSCGMTLEQQAYTMMALGCVDVLSLDGGGSSTMMTQREALSATSIRNTPCYGFARPIATSLMVCTSAKPTNEFDHLAFNEAAYIVYPLHSVSVKYAGCDENGYKADIPAGKLVVEDESYGTLVGSTFYAKQKEGTVNLNYVVNGEVVDSVTVTITKDADSFIETGMKNYIRLIGNLIDMFLFLIKKLTSLFA